MKLGPFLVSVDGTRRALAVGDIVIMGKKADVVQKITLCKTEFNNVHVEFNNNTGHCVSVEDSYAEARV